MRGQFLLVTLLGEGLRKGGSEGIHVKRLWRPVAHFGEDEELR